jgi:hypothetical protein
MHDVAALIGQVAIRRKRGEETGQPSLVPSATVISGQISYVNSALATVRTLPVIMDPLSIIAGTLTIGDVAVKIIKRLEKIRHKADIIALIYNECSDLQLEFNALKAGSTVLQPPDADATVKRLNRRIEAEFVQIDAFLESQRELEKNLLGRLCGGFRYVDYRGIWMPCN